MGLDIVEMIMRVEEEFTITIEDEEASYIHTVGQLHMLILSKTGVPKPGRCASSATFYQLRRALVDLSVAPRRDIAPATSMAALLPAYNRRQGWKAWSETAQFNLPALEKPRWVRNTHSLSVVASLAVGPFFYICTPNFVIFYCATVFALCYLTYKWNEQYANELPANCASFGGATKAVMKLNLGITADWDKLEGADEVWCKLKAIVVDEIGVAPDEVTPGADFIRDLRTG